eukprot:9154101-Prorocentrum_lima.AAC.1
MAARQGAAARRSSSWLRCGCSALPPRRRRQCARGCAHGRGPRSSVPPAPHQQRSARASPGPGGLARRSTCGPPQPRGRGHPCRGCA